MCSGYTQGVIVLASIIEVAAISFVSNSNYNTSLQVITKYGIVQGHEGRTINGKSFYLYQGIPYAKPPVAQLRFRDPMPIQRWKGVLNATIEASNCVEAQLRTNRLEVPGHEDCLYLNIYSPINPNDIKTVRPVLFWIYGGAFLFGTSSIDLYGPEFLIDHNLVVITFNYRLNLFGFLSTGDEAAPGNIGLKDQNAALRWVKNNINKFGGDSNRITIAGHSAGSCSVLYHMLSQKSRGLFSGAIALSGDTLTTWSNQRAPKNVAFDIGLYVGIETNNSTELLERLREVNIEDLKDALLNVALVHNAQLLQNGLSFSPNVERDHKGAFITELTYDALKNGNIAKVPLMLGVTNNEALFFADVIRLARPLLMVFDLSPGFILNRKNIPDMSRRRKLGELIKQRYFRNKAYSSAPEDELTQYFTDYFFTIPQTKTAKLLSKYIPVYFFVYSMEIPEVKLFYRNMGYPNDINKPGAGHSEDLACIWKAKCNDLLIEQYKSICNKITTLWANFATYGNPTPMTDPFLHNLVWPAFSESNNNSYLAIDKHLIVSQNYRNEFVKFWDIIYSYNSGPHYTY